jgi:hypothetical protein
MRPEAAGGQFRCEATLERELRQMIQLVRSGALASEYPFNTALDLATRVNDIALSGDGEPTTVRKFDEIVETVARVKKETGLDDAKLYLRDRLQYLLVRHDPQGGLIFDGYDGRQSWRIRAGVLEETKEGLGAGGIPMPPMMADVPFCDLHETLERIRVDYTVEQLDLASPASGGQPLRHVRVRRNSREVKGPDTIEIWADSKTAVPRRIVFDDAKLPGNPVPCRLTFDLVGEDPLPPDWFNPAPHTSDSSGDGPR